MSSWARPERPLTPGERRLAAAWLPPGLDLDAVRIRRGRFLPGQPARVAMTPFGVPYFPDPLYSDDFAGAPLAQQALFIHELVHAWQYRQGVAVAWQGLWLHLGSRRRGAGPYAYRLQPGRALAAYNIEQQAQIVEDAFRLAHGAPARYPQDGSTLADYRALVRDAGTPA